MTVDSAVLDLCFILVNRRKRKKKKNTRSRTDLFAHVYGSFYVKMVLSHWDWTDVFAHVL